MVTEANPYLSDGHRPRENGVCEDAINVPAHVLSCLLVEFLETQIVKSEAKIRLLLTEVRVEISTDDGRFIWSHNSLKMFTEAFVVLAPVDVDDIHPFFRDFSNLKITLSHINQVGKTWSEVCCNSFPFAFGIKAQVKSWKVVILK